MLNFVDASTSCVHGFTLSSLFKDLEMETTTMDPVDVLVNVGDSDDNEVITYLKHVVQETQRVMGYFAAKHIPSVTLQQCK